MCGGRIVVLCEGCMCVGGRIVVLCEGVCRYGGDGLKVVCHVWLYEMEPAGLGM